MTDYRLIPPGDHDSLPVAVERVDIDRPPPEARPATRLAAVLVLVAVFAVGVVIGQSGGFGSVAPTHSPPGTAVGSGTPPAGITCARGASDGAAPLPAGAPADFDVFWQALACIRESFVGRDDIDERELTYGAIRGLVEALGDTGHSTFLTPEALASEESTLNGRVVGIGALLGTEDGQPVVVSVISGGPASRAGMRSGDVILSVDGEDVSALAPDEVAAKIRGDEGTTVVVEILRPSTDESLEFSMVREPINFPAASWAFVPGTRIADLRLIQFSSGAADELRAARDAAVAQGATGLLLDLRSNPGGYVAEAVRVASQFIGGRTVYIRELADDSRVAVGSCFPADHADRPPDDTCRDQDSGAPTDLPLVVLIDEGTASSAEIVSGALRSAGRGELVGQTTFGTGTVLLTYRLADNSAVRIAVERWLTPDGELIFDKGIEPTIAVEMPADARALEPQEVAQLDEAALAAADPQLAKALEILRAAGAR